VPVRITFFFSFRISLTKHSVHTNIAYVKEVIDMKLNTTGIIIAVVVVIVLLAAVGFGTFSLGKSIGQKEGFIAGEASGISQGEKIGYTKGFSDGKADGEKTGYNKGYEAIQDLIALLTTESGDTDELYEGEQVGYTDGYSTAYYDAWYNAWQTGWLVGYEYLYLAADIDVDVEHSTALGEFLADLPGPGEITIPDAPSPPSFEIPEHPSRFLSGTGTPSLPDLPDKPSLPSLPNLPRR
jgi:hypothetical protein